MTANARLLESAPDSSLLLEEQAPDTLAEESKASQESHLRLVAPNERAGIAQPDLDITTATVAAGDNDIPDDAILQALLAQDPTDRLNILNVLDGMLGNVPQRAAAVMSKDVSDEKIRAAVVSLGNAEKPQLVAAHRREDAPVRLVASLRNGTANDLPVIAQRVIEREEPRVAAYYESRAMGGVRQTEARSMPRRSTINRARAIMRKANGSSEEAPITTVNPEQIEPSGQGPFLEVEAERLNRTDPRGIKATPNHHHTGSHDAEDVSLNELLESGRIVDPELQPVTEKVSRVKRLFSRVFKELVSSEAGSSVLPAHEFSQPRPQVLRNMKQALSGFGKKTRKGTAIAANKTADEIVRQWETSKKDIGVVMALGGLAAAVIVGYHVAKQTYTNYENSQQRQEQIKVDRELQQEGKYIDQHGFIQKLPASHPTRNNTDVPPASKEAPSKPTPPPAAKQQRPITVRLAPDSNPWKLTESQLRAMGNSNPSDAQIDVADKAFMAANHLPDDKDVSPGVYIFPGRH